MRELTDFEIAMLMAIKHELMDSDGHNKTNIQEECKSEIEAIEKVSAVLRGENK